MQSAWRRFGVDETPYEVDDHEALLGELCGAEWARAFFDDFVHGSSIPDYGPLLFQAGFSLEVRGRAGTRRVTLDLIEDPRSVVGDRASTGSLSAAERSFRAAWLDGS